MKIALAAALPAFLFLAPAAHALTLPVISTVFSKSRDHVLDLFERQFLTGQLEAFRGNVTEAASASRMTRQNFQRLMKKHRITSRSFRK